MSNVWKRYGTRAAVKDLSLAIPAGVIFGLLGPNGAGKTTTIEMIAGLREVSEGTLEVLGLDPKLNRGLLSSRVAIQPQEASLFSTLTATETFELWASFYDRPANPRRLIEKLGLQPAERTRFSRLSGGQKRRLLVGTALIAHAELLILDEPTTGLDPTARDQLWDVLRDSRMEGCTILMSTHSMQEAESLADLVAIIDNGTLKAIGSPRDLIREYGGGQVLTYTDEAGVRHEERVAEPVLRLANLSASGQIVQDVELRSGDLDEVFRRLTGRPMEVPNSK